MGDSYMTSNCFSVMMRLFDTFAERLRTGGLRKLNRSAISLPPAPATRMTFRKVSCAREAPPLTHRSTLRLDDEDRHSSWNPAGSTRKAESHGNWQTCHFYKPGFTCDIDPIARPSLCPASFVVTNMGEEGVLAFKGLQSRAVGPPVSSRLQEETMDMTTKYKLKVFRC